MGGDGLGAGGLAEEGDVGGVAAELFDVGADPGESGGLVEQAVVSGGVVGALGGEGGVGEEAEDAETVVHGDDDDVAVSEELAVLTALGGASVAKAAAVDPEHDGEVFGFGGSPDVKGKAVLAGAGVVEDHVGDGVGLKAVGAEVFCGAGAFPGGGGLGGLPAEGAYGWGGVGDALEGQYAAVGG